jgi:hypothetical protein
LVGNQYGDTPQVIIECQKHDGYQESIRWLLSHLKEHMEHGRRVAQEKESEGVKVLKSDPALKQATKELRALLERFANGESIDIIIDAVNALVDDAQRDKEFKDWFKKVDTYIHKVRPHTYIQLTYPNLVYPIRFSSNPVSSSSQRATRKATNSENPVDTSTTTSTRVTLTTCSMRSGIGSRRWERIR